MADYIPPDLPQAQKENLQRYYDASQKTPDQIYENTVQGAMETSKGFLGSGEQLAQEAKQFGVSSDAGRSSAIAGKYAGDYYKNMDELHTRARLQSREDYFSNLMDATELAGRESQLNKQIEMAKYMAKMRKKAARKSTIASVLGIVGAGVGMYATAGMGPAAMAMGGQAGMNIGRGAGSL